MTQQVQVPGVGLLQFPDGMSQPDMAAAIHQNFPQLGPNPATASADNDTPAPAATDAAPATPAATAPAAAPPAKPSPLTFGQAFRGALGMNVAPLANAAATAAAAPKVAAQMATGTVAAPVAGYAGAATAGARALGLTNADPASVVKATQSAMTYQPSSPIAQGLASGVGFLPGKLAQGADWAGGKVADATGSPALGAATNAGIQGLPLIAGIKPTAAGVTSAGSAVANLLRKAPALTAEQILQKSAMSSPQSTSAAAAAPSLTKVSPQLRQAISTEAQKSGGAINPDTLQRHIQADTLPVPMQLTEGQAGQDPMLISEEQNLRGQNPGMVERLNGQNQQLIDNLQSLRDSTGPDVFSTNQPAHADTLIDAYNAKNDAAQADITAKYKALKDANGGQFPVDAPALLGNVTSALHQDLLFDHAPPAVMSTLNRLADKDNMTFENYESLRTNLARIQRSSQDGNEVAAAGVIRNAMEQLPLQPEAAALKPLADTARAAAKTQFDITANKDSPTYDPAYSAAVNGTTPPDAFINKFVINAPRDDVATMRQNLSDNPTALQTLGVATIDHLRNAARISDNGTGNFAQAGYNKAFQNLQPKIGSLVDPKTAETLQNVGDVARYTQFQPRGSFVNNSNTMVANVAKYGGGALEHGVNMAFHGVPVGTIGRGVLQKLSTAKRAQQSLAPGAGLSRLAAPTGARPPGAAPFGTP